MAFLEQIEEFRTWATSLGCPPSALPNDDALKSIFKSKQKQLFVDMQSRVQPRQHVQTIRENLLIAKVGAYKDKMFPACERIFLPRELQTHLKVQELQRQKETAELKLSEVKKEYEILASSIKTKNIQAISAQHKKDLLESKYNLLHFKLESLNKSYGQELQNKTQIESTMPVKLSSNNSSEKQANKAVDLAIKELENFYQICDSNNHNGAGLSDTKQQLWAQMRNIFANTPNFLLFNAIMKIKEEQLQHIVQLNRTNNNADTQSSYKLEHGILHLDKFNVKLLKTKADLFGIVAKYMCTQDEVTQLETSFSVAFSVFVDELRKKVNHFNGISDDSTDQIISEYVVQYNMLNFNRAQNEFLTQQIEELRQELELGAKQLENHELLLGAVKQMYSEINTSVNRIQCEMLQLSQIKEKILYSKNMMKNMLDDMHAASQNFNAKTQLMNVKIKVNNLSLMGMESFNLANDSVFSSTKFDFDANTSSMNSTRRTMDNTTLKPPANASTTPALPSHLTELNTFAETPLNKLSIMPLACAFLLSANPLIVESQELASTVQLAPGLLLTPYGALQEVRKRILWASAIAAHTSDLKFNLDVIIVNPHEYKMRARHQNEEILQLLDNMEAINGKSQHMLQKAKRIYRFILDNPLRNYVPPTKTYNNVSYADYESEFNLYHRIAITGGSIK